MFSFLLARIKIFSLYLHYFMFEPGFFLKLFFINNWKVKVLSFKLQSACLGEDKIGAGAAWCCSMQCCAQASPGGAGAGWMQSELLIKPSCVAVQQGEGVEGVWGCLGTGLAVMLSCSPGTRLVKEQRSCSVRLCGAAGDCELILPLGNPLEECSVGVHFCFLNSALCLGFTKSKNVHYSKQKLKLYFSIT